MTARARVQTIVPVVLLIIAAVVATDIVPYKDILRTERSIDAATERLATLRAENDRLEGEIEALSTEAEMERLARSQFGYVEPGEIAYVITDPGIEPATPSEESVIPPRLAWYEVVWAFLTGRDISQP